MTNGTPPVNSRRPPGPIGPAGEELLTVAEIAERLRLNQQTIRNWIERGALPAIRIGRRVRVKRIDFEALLARPAGPAGPPDPALQSYSAEQFWAGKPHPGPRPA